MHFAATRIVRLISAIALLTEVKALEVIFPYSYIVKGESYRILWSPGDDTSTMIQLIRGPATNMIYVEVLSRDAVKGSFDWTPSESLVSANDYALALSPPNGTGNYSMLFGITDRASALAKTLSSSVLSSATPAPSPGSSPTTTASKISASKSTLNTGEIAGIGVGAAIGGLIIAFLAFFLSHTLRRKSKPVAAITESWAVGGKPELDSKTLYGMEAACEMDAEKESRELHADAVIGEADANNALYELHAESRQIVPD